MYDAIIQIALLGAFTAIGALGAIGVMRWHHNEKDRAVRAEMAKTEHWRSEAERARLTAAEKTFVPSQVVELTAAPLPMSFGPQEEMELRENGGFIRQRRNNGSI